MTGPVRIVQTVVLGASQGAAAAPVVPLVVLGVVAVAVLSAGLTAVLSALVWLLGCLAAIGAVVAGLVLVARRRREAFRAFGPDGARISRGPQIVAGRRCGSCEIAQPAVAVLIGPSGALLALCAAHLAAARLSVVLAAHHALAGPQDVQAGSDAA